MRKENLHKNQFKGNFIVGDCGLWIATDISHLHFKVRPITNITASNQIDEDILVKLISIHHDFDNL